MPTKEPTPPPPSRGAIDCPICEGEGTIHDAKFEDGDSDQQMFLMQDTLRPCPACSIATSPPPPKAR
jgi:hypothetical protein